MGGLVRHLLGWLSIGLGVIGLFLPFLQGWLLIAVGALLLAPEIPFFARLADRIERRVPGIGSALRRWREKLAARPNKKA
jgi:uncharacterized membrane protein YbaN (DUF454 family)